MKGSFHGIDKTNKARKMAPCAKAFAATMGAPHLGLHDGRKHQFTQVVS